MLDISHEAAVAVFGGFALLLAGIYLGSRKTTLARVLVVAVCLVAVAVGLSSIGGDSPDASSDPSAATDEPTPAKPLGPSDASESTSPEPDPPPTRTPCLASRSNRDAEDGMLSKARGPMKSGVIYRGTMYVGDQDWWGFCVAFQSRVEIRFENSCSISPGQGPTNLIAEVTDRNGAGITQFRPDPGTAESLPVAVKPDEPYYIHVFDLYDLDVGDDEGCGEVPWALTVTGPLTSTVGE